MDQFHLPAWRNRFAFMFVLFFTGLTASTPAFTQSPSEIGQWGPILDWGVQAKHMILLPTGDVLVWSTGENTRVWDPSTDDSFTPVPFPGGDLHCAAQTTLADGRIMVGGGQAQETHEGTQITALFDAFTNTWTQGADMNKARWYATLLALDDGRVVITTGDDANKERVLEPEIYDPIADTWTLLSGASRADTLYVFMYQLPDGRIFQAGPREPTYFLDITGDGAWSDGPRIGFGSGGYSVSSAMYRPGKILNSGGDDPSVADATVIDMNVANPQWRDIAPMNFERRRHDLTIMPDGKVIAIGGTGRLDDDNYAVMEAEIFDPDTETWTVMAAMDEARMYHSSTVLLPDGRIVAGGGEGGERRKHAQVFSPPYLFKGARPAITSAPESIGYGSTFVVNSPDAADIVSIAIIRGAGATHTYDQSQRYIPLTFSASGQSLTIDAPADAFTASPGYYMLFLVNSAGVPAIAPFMRVAEGADLVPGSISGTVTNSGGQPVQGAAVSYPGGSTATDASGDYSFGNVSAGTQTLTVAAPTYATSVQAVPVTSGLDSVVDFTLVLSGTVTGHVEAEATLTPIAGANIAYPGGSVTTDAAGNFTVTDVPQGLQSLTATAVAFEGQTLILNVIAGGSVFADFHLHPGHTVIEGEVLDSSLQPIEGATVSYPGGSVVTDFAGFYLLNDVPEGTHRVTASAPGYISHSDPAIVITGFETTLDFALEPEGLPQDVYFPTHDAKVNSGGVNSNYGSSTTLRVRLDTGIYNSYLQFNVTGLSEPPVSAKLRLRVTNGSADGGSLYAVTQPFDENTITYANAPACDGTPIAFAGAVTEGDWVEFDVTSQLGSSGTYGFCLKSNSTNSALYSAKEGADSPELVVARQGGGPLPTGIMGAVADIESGQPIVGATISYSGGNTQTNDFGGYIFNDVAPGTHSVSASAVGYVQGSDSVVVVSEQTSTLDFSLDPLGGGAQDTYFANNDAKVKSSSPNTNYSSDTLRVRLDSTGVAWKSYVQFGITGLSTPPLSATLRLYVTNGSPDGGSLYTVTQPFDENTITYANAQACGGTLLASAGAVVTDEWVEFDVTSVIGTSGIYGFCLSSASSNSVFYSAREGTHPPELAIVADTGTACSVDSDCNDDLFCNGQESCNAGVCVAGPVVSCDDGDSCTLDICDESTNACLNTDTCGSCSVDADCDDSLFCNGTEVCELGICQTGAPPVCDDGVFCNGAELCDEVSGCLSSPPQTCDDGVSCTSDSCDVTSDQCINATNDAFCSNGLFCDGTEFCDATADCQQPLSLPCAGLSCNEAFDVCPAVGPSPIIGEVQTGKGTDVTSLQTAVSLTGVDGDLYIASIATKPHRDVLSVEGLGLSWQEAIVQCGARSATGLAVWVAQGTPTGSDIVSANLATSTRAAVLTAVRYTNVSATAIGNIVGGNTNGDFGACSGGTDQNTWTQALQIDNTGATAFVALAKRQRLHTPADFDIVSDELQGSGGSAAGLVIGNQIFDTTGTAVVSGTFKGKVDWAAVVIEIVPASGTGSDNFVELPPVPVPPENPITEEKRILGKILFWDEQLSSDDTVACGTCHLPSAGGADPRLGQHPGPDGIFGNDDDVNGSPGIALADLTNTPIAHPDFGFEPQVTRRSSPVFIGAQWAHLLFVDGAAGHHFHDPVTGVMLIATGAALENQAVRPPLATAEMANQGRDWSAVVAKLEVSVPLSLATNLPADIAARLASSPTYPDLFQDAFGDPAVTAARLVFAIATYERTLVSDQTPWDLFMAGDTTALTPNQQLGWDAFQDSLCASCHLPPLFTNGHFHNIGVRPPDEDLGKQEVTGLETDRGKFKTPTLRNAALKSSFMHNGKLTTMGQALDFYLNDRGDQFLDSLDPLMPLVDVPDELQLPLLDFLENGLTDPRVANEEFPFDRPTLSTE
ncbi:MAG: carboxypeptidase regulatory-like domain-containing protein [Halioglobus sp.]